MALINIINLRQNFVDDWLDFYPLFSQVIKFRSFYESYLEYIDIELPLSSAEGIRNSLVRNFLKVNLNKIEI